MDISRRYRRRRGGAGRCRPWRDEQAAAAEGRGTDIVCHRPAEADRGTEVELII